MHNNYVVLSDPPYTTAYNVTISSSLTPADLSGFDIIISWSVSNTLFCGPLLYIYIYIATDHRIIYIYIYIHHFAWADQRPVQGNISYISLQPEQYIY